MSKKQISIYPFRMICDLMVNYMEIQDFVKLPCISLLRYTWNDMENVLENCETILEKVLEKCLNLFCENLYSPCKGLFNKYWLLGQLLAWRQIGNKPLTKQLMSKFYDATWHH